MLSNTWLLLGWGAPSVELRVSFPSPSGPLKVGSAIQEFRAQVRKAGDTVNPDVTIELYETGGSTPIATVLPAAIVSAGSGGEVVAGMWDAALLANASGAAVECRVVGIARSGSTVEIGALEFNYIATVPIQAGFIPASTEFFGAAITSQGANTGLEVGFANPTRVLEPGAGLQEFRVQVRKQGAGGTDPTVSLELWEGATKRADVVTNQSVSSTAGTVVAGTWNATSLVDSSGSNIRLKIIGGGVADGRLEIGAVEWNAQLSEKGLVVGGFLPAPGDFYGARVYGDPVTVTAGFLPDSSQLYGATVRGHVAQAGVFGEIAAGPFPVGRYTVGINRNADMFGATVSTSAATGGHERVKPNQILAMSGLSGVVTDIDEAAEQPDQAFLTASF